MSEDGGSAIALRRKRLMYRASYTGMKETDILLGAFARRHLAAFGERQLDLFERILEAGDPQIYAWITGREPVPPAYDNDVMMLMRNFKIYDPSH